MKAGQKDKEKVRNKNTINGSAKNTRNVLNKKFIMESVIEVDNVIKVTATLLLFLRFLQ